MARLRSYWAVAKPGTSDVIVARDGFHILAAIAPLLWALYHRQWRWAFFLALIAVSCSGITYVVAEHGMVALMTQAIAVTLNVWYGFEAQNLRYADFLRLGYIDLGPVQAPDLDAADRTGLALWHQHTYSQSQ